ncbi:MAG: efflux RND transporter permease subunit, partial [Candidatus Hydrogenedentes bacterium]|nr:efflux RND transporter permease subunit [Candidatus Hydrogenedentota bacterium]
LHQRILTAIREAAERHIKSDLEAETGIAQVLVKGGQEQEIQVLVDAQLTKSLGVSIQAIAGSLAQQNINLSGGRLREGKTEYLVRTLNEFRDVNEIKDSIIGMSGDRQIRLADVATVFSGEKERETIVRINGQEAVAMDIYKEGDANTVQVCNKIKDILGFKRDIPFTERLFIAMAESRTAGGKLDLQQVSSQQRVAKAVQSHLPQGAKFSMISDQSRFIIASIKEVQSATLQGGLLALIVLFLFLRDLRSTMVIGIAIPISLISAFIPMFMRGISLNTMSLGGLALGVGMLVDNSIVVLESVFRCREEGDNAKDAAERGTHEVAGAITSSTLTTVAVFFPIAFVEGVAGQIFSDLALTVTFSLLASLLVALYLNPMMVSYDKIKLGEGREVVWILRAYRQARADRSVGRLAALLRIIPIGFRYAAQWVRQTARDSFGSTANAFRRIGADGRYFTSLLGAGFQLLLLPFILVVFPIHIGLKLTAVLLVTVLFVASLAVIAVLWIARKIFSAVFWLPLTVFNAGYNAMRDTYEKMLRGSLKMSFIIILIVIALAVHAGYLAVGLGRELIPQLKQGEFGIRMEAPPGTRLEDTEVLAQRIEQVILQTPEVDSVAIDIGSEKTKTAGERGENVAQFNVLLKDPKINSKRQDQIIDSLRNRVMQVSSEEITFTLPTLFSFKTAVELQIRGDELSELKRVGQNVITAIQDVKGLKDAELSVKKGYPEIIIQLDRDKLAAKNISPIDVAQRLRGEVQGEVSTQLSQSGEKIDIRVRSDQARLKSLQDLRSVSVVDGSPPIPLSDVASIDIEDGPSEIRRIDQRQVVTQRLQLLPRRPEQRTPNLIQKPSVRAYSRHFPRLCRHGMPVRKPHPPRARHVYHAPGLYRRHLRPRLVRHQRQHRRLHRRNRSRRHRRQQRYRARRLHQPAPRSRPIQTRRHHRGRTRKAPPRPHDGHHHHSRPRPYGYLDRRRRRNETATRYHRHVRPYLRHLPHPPHYTHGLLRVRRTG